MTRGELRQLIWKFKIDPIFKSFALVAINRASEQQIVKISELWEQAQAGNVEPLIELARGAGIPESVIISLSNQMNEHQKQ